MAKTDAELVADMECPVAMCADRHRAAKAALLARMAGLRACAADFDRCAAQLQVAEAEREELREALGRMSSTVSNVTTRAEVAEAEVSAARISLGNALVTGGMNWPLAKRVEAVMEEGAKCDKERAAALNRAGQAEARVKELEARVHYLQPMEGKAARVEQMDEMVASMARQVHAEQARAAAAESRVRGCKCKELVCGRCGAEESAPHDEGDACTCGGEFVLHGVYAVAAAAQRDEDIARARITQLEADLAAARTTNAHALVQEVMRKVVLRYAQECDGGHACRGGACCDAADDDVSVAVAKMLDAGITIQPVRTLSKQEAETLNTEQERLLDAARARITQLEADLAAARTINAHALVQEVVTAARGVWDTSRGTSIEWDRKQDVGEALAALDAAGITIQPVRTLSKQEAERRACAHIIAHLRERSTR